MNVKYGVICLLAAIFLLPSVGMSQQTIHWEPTLESAQRLAAQSDRLVLIQFWAQWCGVCKRMESEVFTNQGTISVLSEKYVPVKVNADHFPATARRYGITALPTTVIATPDGRLVDMIRGKLETPQYIDQISRVAAEVEKRRATEAVSASQNNHAPTGNTQKTNPAQPNQVAAAVPPAQPAPNMTGPASTPPTSYVPPTGYSPQPAGQVPSARPMAAAQPPFANHQPNQPNAAAPADKQPTQYNNPPSTYGKAPYQAPPSPAYGSQSPPAMPVKSPVVSNPPVANIAAQSQPPLNPNPYAVNAAVQPPAYNSQPPVMNNQPPVANNQPPVPINQPAMAGNPQLCIDGFCPVTLCEKQSWVQGDVRWGAIHRGRTYLFTGPEEQKRFFADPDCYAPVGSGNDVVLAAEQGRAIPGMREHGVFFGSRIYLFASEESLLKFAEKPEVYANQVLNRISQRP